MIAPPETEIFSGKIFEFKMASLSFAKIKMEIVKL